MQTRKAPTFWAKLKHIFPIVVLDSFFYCFSVWLAFGLRLNNFWSNQLIHNWLLFPIILVIGIPSLYFCGVYRSNLRYAGVGTAKKITMSVVVTVLIVLALWVMLFAHSRIVVPRTCWFIIMVLAIGFLGAYRLMIRDHLRKQYLKNSHRKYVLIYGAGSAGTQLQQALRENLELKVVGFLDDAPMLEGQDIDGIRIYHPDALKYLIEKQNISSVLLAIPSLSQFYKRSVIDRLTQYPIEVLIMPSLVELATGVRKVDDLRKVNIEDLLGRDSVSPEQTLIESCIKGKSVLVTGAGGSIGSELCRQIILQSPRYLVLVEMSEYQLYCIDAELRELIKDHDLEIQLIPILGSVLRRTKMAKVMQHFQIQTVYHAAAYKHVPIVERNMIEGVQNNIFGTLNCALAAIEADVEIFVLISTDKAVRPTNIMGATKRFSEIILQSLSKSETVVWKERIYERKDTIFCMVRFGNVLGSSGSVVPKFTAQIMEGGPLTVTHKEMIRYFMTIPEAAQLVIQAGSLGKGGDVFLLDMGEPVKIYDLARRMIELSGYKVLDETQPDGDIEIKVTGLRPGEKLYEELLIGEKPLSTEHPKIFTANENCLQWKEVSDYLKLFDEYSKTYNYEGIKKVLLESVEGYHPENESCDWLVEEYKDENPTSST